MAEIKCTGHDALSKWPINQFKSVQQSRQHPLRAYCPDIYFVTTGQLSVKLLQDQELNYESDDKNYNILVYAKDKRGFGGQSSGKMNNW